MYSPVSEMSPCKVFHKNAAPFQRKPAQILDDHEPVRHYFPIFFVFFVFVTRLTSDGGAGFGRGLKATPARHGARTTGLVKIITDTLSHVKNSTRYSRFTVCF